MLNATPTYFQSHFGLILSVESWCSHHSCEISFNPILVWFYLNVCIYGIEFTFHLSIPFWSDFIVYFFPVSAETTSFFQSHFGLILSHTETLFNEVKNITFNPILVWFYLPAEWVIYRPRPSTFNPILVWFYRNRTEQNGRGLRQGEPTFNPILVWFYHVTDRLPFSQALPFQSHFGLILSQQLT